MQKKIKKNIKQLYLFQNLEKKRLILKIISKNLNINNQMVFLQANSPSTIKVLFSSVIGGSSYLFPV